MGKRELLLIAVFVLVGLGVYQVTAPAGPASGGFSIAGLIEHIRSEIRGQNVEVQVRRSAAAPVPPSVTTLRLDGIRGVVTILGEAREDVTAELQTTAFGADEAQAKQFAKAFELALVPEGDILDVRVKSAAADMRRRRRLELTLRVPERLAVDLATLGGELKIARVARVMLRRGAGRAILSEIPGVVEGEFGAGSLEIDKAGSVTLETDRTELRISNIAGSATLAASGNELRVRAVSGPTTMTLERVEAEGEDLRGPVTVEGEGGECRLREVQGPIEVKGDRLTLRVTLDKPMAITAAIENDFIELTLPRTGGLTLDVRAERGQIRVPDRVVEVETSDDESWARGPVRGGGPLLKLHTIRGDITIR